MSGKVRDGFVEWMVENNAFDIDLDLTLSNDEYNKEMFHITVLAFYDASEKKRNELKYRFDNK